MVRHTPAFGHPSPRGDGLTHHICCQYIIGFVKCRCRAIPSRRRVPQSGGVCRTVKPMPYISRRTFGALDAWLRLCAGVPLRSTPAYVPSPLRGSGERTDYRIGLDCCRNASKRHHLNNPRQTKCSLGIRVLSLVSVSERRHHINEFFACPETVFGRDQLRSLYIYCTTAGAGIVRVLRFRLVAQFDLTLVNILGVLRGNSFQRPSKFLEKRNIFKNTYVL